MNATQKLIQVDNCKDLYALIAFLGDAAAEGADSVVLWSQDENSALFEEMAQLELVELYAQRFSLKIVLSAAADLTLRQLANRVGWKVLWQMPEMDAILIGHAIEKEANRWVFLAEDELQATGD